MVPLHECGYSTLTVCIRAANGGIVGIPLPRSVGDALLAEGLAEEHQWVPNLGWITFRVRSDEHLKHAAQLMRFSYFRYALKSAFEPRKLFMEASQELHLTPRFKSLLEQFVPGTKNHGLPDALSVDVAEDVAKVEGLLRAASTGEKRDSSLRFPPSAGLAE